MLEYAIPALGLAMSTYLEDSQGQKQWLYTHLTSAIITQGLKKSIKKETPKVLKEEVNSNDNVAEVKEEKKSTWNKIVDFFIDDDDE